MTDTARGDALERVRRAGLIAVLRADDPDDGVGGCRSVDRRRVTAIEVTFTTPDAASVIARLRERHGDRLQFGAGTITAAGVGVGSALAPRRIADAAARDRVVALAGQHVAAAAGGTPAKAVMSPRRPR